MRNRKKQIFFLLCLVVLIILIIAFLIGGNQQEQLSTDYQRSEDTDIITYNGKEYEYNEHLSNFLFLGIDTREAIETYETREDAGQADTIFLLSLNRYKKTLQCLAIPRDTITDVQMIAPDGTDLGTTKDHINIQYAFGDGKRESCELMKQSVSHLLYNVPIQGYCSLNMDGIPLATDVLGGVEVVIPDNTLEAVVPEFKQGVQVTITGETAERFVRYRDANVSQSAMDRMNRQIVFMKAFANKAQTVAAKDASFIIDMLDSVEDYMVTNIGKDMFAKMLESSYNEEGIYVLPGEGVTGEYFDEYHVNEDELYELILQMFYKEVQDD